MVPIFKQKNTYNFSIYELYMLKLIVVFYEWNVFHWHTVH